MSGHVTKADVIEEECEAFDVGTQTNGTKKQQRVPADHPGVAGLHEPDRYDFIMCNFVYMAHERTTPCSLERLQVSQIDNSKSAWPQAVYRRE